jgi:predicted MFS family arabinose efflux permease
MAHQRTSAQGGRVQGTEARTLGGTGLATVPRMDPAVAALLGVAIGAVIGNLIGWYVLSRGR